MLLWLYCPHIPSYSKDDVVLHLQELIWMITTEDKIELPDTRILFLYLSFSSHVTGTNVAASPFLVCLPCTFMIQQCNVTHVYCLQFHQSGTYMRMEICGTRNIVKLKAIELGFIVLDRKNWLGEN